MKAATPPSSGGTWVKTAVKRSYETRSRVEPRTSALNMTLPAAAARASAAIDRYLLHAPELSSKPAARCCCCRSMGQTDGRTDTRPLHSPCSASINVNLNLSTFTYTLKSSIPASNVSTTRRNFVVTSFCVVFIFCSKFVLIFLQ